jgi:hypothetical protein
MRCPKCFGRDVRPSQHRGVLDTIMGKFSRDPYRCRGCHNRFYVYIHREVDDVEREDEEDAVEAEGQGTEHPGPELPERKAESAPNPDSR